MKNTHLINIEYINNKLNKEYSLFSRSLINCDVGTTTSTQTASAKNMANLHKTNN